MEAQTNSYVNIDISIEELRELLRAATEKEKNVRPGEWREFYRLENDESDTILIFNLTQGE